ncbi:LacI family DNA-binding transcriptional regulator, partial [Stenotrophomonas sp. MB339]|uniref:LacI family DNA-binding transcriptional regulator n=1 Tax=Stenotrophomonas sp. MB339 TaxID=1663558 RepID=UPI00209B5DC1
MKTVSRVLNNEPNVSKSTRARVLLETFGSLLSTRETVFIETPAVAATSSICTRPGLPANTCSGPGIPRPLPAIASPTLPNSCTTGSVPSLIHISDPTR